MTTTIEPAQTLRPGPAVGWAVTSGVLGVGANVLLVLFFVVAQPFSGYWSPYAWLGPANDVAVAAQFLTLIPVATLLRRWLPVSRAVRAATALGIAAMVIIAGLQLLLVIGVIDFSLQIWLVIPAFLPVYGWVFLSSAVAHRRDALDRAVTRSGLLLGSSFPVALVITGAGYGVGTVMGLELPLALPGIAFGGLGWLALPLWPLLLARLVFSRPPRPAVGDTSRKDER